MVLEQTLARAAAAGLRVAPLDSLPTLQDIDTIEVGGRRTRGRGGEVGGGRGGIIIITLSNSI